MAYVEIHDTETESSVILESLQEDGLVGVHGGRIQVRNKLKEVRALIKNENLSGYFAHSTINHPETELGYSYDENKYTVQQAEKYVTHHYNNKNA